MKTAAKITLALAALLAGTATSAATLTEQSTITVDVLPYCQLTPPGDQVFDLSNGTNYAQRVTYLQVLCNQDMPYTLETDADPNGRVFLADQVSGLVVPAYLRQQTGPGAYDTPWGQAAYGEGWSRTGTGGLENVMFRIDVNYDSIGMVMGNKPAVGSYTKTVNFTLTY